MIQRSYLRSTGVSGSFQKYRSTRCMSNLSKRRSWYTFKEESRYRCIPAWSPLEDKRGHTIHFGGLMIHQKIQKERRERELESIQRAEHPTPTLSSSSVIWLLALGVVWC
ncbi:hypothetical protein KP509_06G018500 [Ceratopteris richardii]|uniref:Uncharacterized protein n=1 Tax=Ceratopteris richardii TaxID=49495 RepID=A0A8T2ULR8_CERRI|nr:hypothetical protein KP509_06G018500 [Ceratopteris richardii]